MLIKTGADRDVCFFGFCIIAFDGLCMYYKYGYKVQINKSLHGLTNKTINWQHMEPFEKVCAKWVKGSFLFIINSYVNTPERVYYKFYKAFLNGCFLKRCFDLNCCFLSLFNEFLQNFVNGCFSSLFIEFYKTSTSGCFLILAFSLFIEFYLTFMNGPSKYSS